MTKKTIRQAEFIRGHCYFLVIGGEVSHGEYMGFDDVSDCRWFRPLPFRNAVNGPQWVAADTFANVRDLGRPLTSEQFDVALLGLLK